VMTLPSPDVEERQKQQVNSLASTNRSFAGVSWKCGMDLEIQKNNTHNNGKNNDDSIDDNNSNSTDDNDGLPNNSTQLEGILKRDSFSMRGLNGNYDDNNNDSGMGTDFRTSLAATTKECNSARALNGNDNVSGNYDGNNKNGGRIGVDLRASLAYTNNQWKSEQSMGTKESMVFKMADAGNFKSEQEAVMNSHWQVLSGYIDEGSRLFIPILYCIFLVYVFSIRYGYTAPSEGLV